MNNRNEVLELLSIGPARGEGNLPSGEPGATILDDIALSERWGMAIQTIRIRRMKGQTPRYFKVGKFVRYYLSDVISYEQEHMVTR